MKKKLFLLALSVLLISGCGKIPKTSNGDEILVSIKGDNSVTVNDFYLDIKNSNAALETLVEMVDTKILEDKYSDKLEDAKADAETNIAALEQYYGDQLETLIQQQTNYSGIEAYKKALALSYLRQLAIKDYCKDQITKKQIEKYYESEIVPDIKVSHILISPKITEDMTDEKKAAAKKEAQDKVKAIIAELNKTDKAEVAEKFAELASAQSDDAVTKNNGGSFGYINKDTLGSEYSELTDAAYKLKDGQYSTKVITTELGYHVILRTETKEKAKLDDVRDSIVDKLAEEYLSQNSVASVTALTELRKSYKMDIIDSELKTKYANYIQQNIDYYQQMDEQNKANQ